MEYLIVVDYHSDAERKRIDATIDRWRSKKDISKEKGVVIRLEGEDNDDFLQDLYSRLERGREGVRYTRGEAGSCSERSRSPCITRRPDKATVKQFLRYILNKLNSSHEGTRNKVESYTAYTRKGQASIGLLWAETAERRLTVVISGFGDVVSFVSGRIDKELTAFLESGK